MRTLKLLTLIVACGLISVSCSNEGIDLPTQESSIESDSFARGGTPALSQSLISVDNVDFIFNVNTDKGKTWVTYIIDSSSSPYALASVGASPNGNLACRPGYTTETRTVELNLTIRLKKNEINGQTFSGCVRLQNNQSYTYSVTLDSKKRFTTAAGRISTSCCP